jgi:hypothetical protein
MALGEELEVELLTPAIRVAGGDHADLLVALRNTVAGEIRGEAQLISPFETWPMTSPWTFGFSVGPGESATLAFRIDPPAASRPGAWWGLVKVMYFGRLHYTPAARIEVSAGR